LLFTAQKLFSTILKFASLQIQNSPFRLKHWICDRFASLSPSVHKFDYEHISSGLSAALGHERSGRME